MTSVQLVQQDLSLLVETTLEFLDNFVKVEGHLQQAAHG